MKTFLKTLVLSTLAIGVVGCQPAATETAKSDPAPPAATGHQHDHGDVGPHGGHLLHLEPSGVHAEWTHDDESKTITVFLDDLDATKISVAKFVVNIPNAAAEEFELAAGDAGWTVSSEALMTHLNMGEAVDVQLLVMEDGTELSTKIEHHDHEHDHAH